MVQPFIATGGMTADGRIVLGHNTMPASLANCYVVFTSNPPKGTAILMQSVPGWIDSGTDFFITDAGLVGGGHIGGFEGSTPRGSRIARFRAPRRMPPPSTSGARS